MKLSLKNIGKIKEASIEIKGITVIAGENDTGKSTVGKTLFAVFNSFYQIEEQIREERIGSVEEILGSLYKNQSQTLFLIEYTKMPAKKIVDNIERYLSDPAILTKEFYSLYKNSIDDESLDEACKDILAVLNVSSGEIIKAILNKKLDLEFNGQINNVFADDRGLIHLAIKESIMSISLTNNVVKEVKDSISLKTEAIYIDDPFVLDQVQRVWFSRSYNNHRDHLRDKLTIEHNEGKVINKIIATNKFEHIYNKINAVCSGDVVKIDHLGIGYKKGKSDKILDVRNLSSGLKTFIILKTLLTNDVLKPNGTIILDEPEIHLHPEWQLLFAELIVLIQKEFGMHILLTTHSPYFLNAIEVYSAKHGIANKCKYYLATVKEETSFIEDVSDNIEIIYSKLARPLQDLENERYQDD
ncbi:AAA family ATPase [Metasolibacillus sp.]|uniref:AAA family ATPase n=1 Tax=Metasolibacillus sp. TaxID=2703680 RepID=UPI0025DBB61B|nr:AAA family ATPase [Metasolibacillus sp.]MCT6923075.1 AAA family ATPase [Metasolibacillus sp.]MCT6939313.1 AAA family ATPase [Metasolibacillus sp.]